MAPPDAGGLVTASASGRNGSFGTWCLDPLSRVPNSGVPCLWSETQDASVNTVKQVIQFEHMFEQRVVVTEPESGCGGDLPVDDELDVSWERLLADADLEGPPVPVLAPVPEWLMDAPAEFGSSTPS
jgi:hypothetical protein